VSKKTFYITTPIYYPSGKLHIGHSYTTVAADAMARYKRLQGYDVMFLTGTDEHGQKIQRVAAENNVTPKEYVDNIVNGIKKLWSLMKITNDKFIRTTDEYHVEAVQKIFKALYAKSELMRDIRASFEKTPSAPKGTSLSRKYLMASRPYFSIKTTGSTTLPLDLDIFPPSRTSQP
jgi:methionyl-tRNA synthetase